MTIIKKLLEKLEISDETINPEKYYDKDKVSEEIKTSGKDAVKYFHSEISKMFSEKEYTYNASYNGYQGIVRKPSELALRVNDNKLKITQN